MPVNKSPKSLLLTSWKLILACSWCILIGHSVGCGGSHPDENDSIWADTAKIDRIALFLENSGSMRGYFQGSSDLKRILGNLLVVMDDEKWDVSQKEAFLIAGKKSPSMSFKTLGSKLSNPKEIIPEPSNSLIPALIDSVVTDLEKRGEAGIGLFVSDFILSKPTEEIHRNREINFDSRDDLKNEIKRIFSKVRNMGYSVAFLGFQSTFDGNYWDYSLNPHPVSENMGKIRPFYMLIIGKNKTLSTFLKKIGKDPSFKTEEGEQIIFGHDPLIKYALLRPTGKFAYKINSTDRLKVDGLNGRADSNIVILGFSGKEIGIDQIESKLFNEPFSIQGNIDATILGIYPNLPSRNKKDIEFAADNRFDTFIKIQITRASKSDTLWISANNPNENWYKDWSCLDDKSYANFSKKTFLLDYTVQGMAEAYEDDNVGGRPILSFKIPITTK